MVVPWNQTACRRYALKGKDVQLLLLHQQLRAAQYTQGACAGPVHGHGRCQNAAAAVRLNSSHDAALCVSADVARCAVTAQRGTDALRCDMRELCCAIHVLLCC